MIFFAFSLIYLPYLFIRRKYHRGYVQRLGVFPEDFYAGIKNKKAIWIHAVSVGEVNASRLLWEKLRNKYTEYKIVLSTTTRTGNLLAKKFALPGDSVIYSPLDLSFVVRKFLLVIKPSLLIILETEIWPNLILKSSRFKIPVVLVNARVSDKAFKRYRLVKFFLKPVLRRISLVLAQSDKDKDRFINLGVNQEKVLVTGNMKFDYVDIKDVDCKKLKRELGLKDKEKLITAGSTHKGEEEIILEAYKELLPQYPDLRLIIAPRHPERTAEVVKLIIKFGFMSIKISSIVKDLPDTEGKVQIFILDTVGQLKDFYAIADIVFVGGSLVKKGGHNIIEPAIFSRPIVSGKHFFNFSDVFKAFQEKNAIIICGNKEELKNCLIELLNKPEEREKLGMRAHEVVLGERGATERNLNWLFTYLDR